MDWLTVLLRKWCYRARGVPSMAKRASPCCPAKSWYIRLVRDRGWSGIYYSRVLCDELRTSGTTVISSPASCRLCGTSTSTSCVSSARVLGYRFSLCRFPRPAFPAPLCFSCLLATARIVRQPELGTLGDSLRASVFFLDRGNLKRARKRLASREHANKNITERSTLAYHLTLPMS